MVKSLFYISICCLFFQCSKPIKKKTNSLLFYQYSALIQRLRNDNVKLTKYISSSEKKDTIYIDTVDWNTELKIFLEADILKNKLVNYKTIESKSNCRFLLQTESSKEAVKKLEYSICNDSLYVNMFVNKVSKIYDFNYHLELSPNGYLIESDQEVSAGYKSIYRIEGKFRK